MHRQVSDKVSHGRLLELGAGNLNHVPYAPDECVYDVVEPFQELWQDSPHLPRINRIYEAIDEIPSGAEYDCILSIAVLEHLTDLPMILANAGLLLRPGGTFRAGFPSEGGFLWNLSWRLTTGIEYRLKRGFDYRAIMRHEHVNTSDEILSLLHYFYRKVNVSRFPLPFQHFSFYVAALAEQPMIDRCRIFTASRRSVGVVSND